MKFSWMTILSVACLALACEDKSTPNDSDGSGGTTGSGSSSGSSGGAPPNPGGPTYHPPPGFEDCVHAEVKEDCEDGWCRIPAGCFVMGSKEGEWHRADAAEQQVAVTLTRPFLLQQTEMTRKQWMDLVAVDPGVDPYFPEQVCLEDDCPITYITWWDAVHAANLSSQKENLAPCYELVGCTGIPGDGLACEGVAEPEKSVYECEGYRLPTRHEFEYAAKAGTTTPFYSGEITVYDDHECHRDVNLEKIAWYCHNSGGTPNRVARLEPNGFGLFDTLGNIIEMMNDPYSTASSPGGNDPGGVIGNHSNRLTMRGAFNVPNWIHRVAGRSTISADARGAAGGLRLARTLHED